jgi:phage gp46-like protein
VTDRRGWWGDHVSPDGENEEEYGSWLWLLWNERLSDDLPARARSYAEQALHWLIRDRVCGRVDVRAGSLRPTQGIWLTVDVYAASGEILYAQKFERLWRDASTQRSL